MLQQTQTERVRGKYREFLGQFPTLAHLARASRSSVVRAWSGLGYNRRALHLHRAAQMVMSNLGGVIPRTSNELKLLPGLGSYSSCAIACFAWEEPATFIETNIRAVFIHEFFRDSNQVSDKDIMPLLGETLDTRDVRTWYYALMDYGTFLKKRYPGLGRKSSHYTRQTKFQGSRREMRGKILKRLGCCGGLSRAALKKHAGISSALFEEVLESLVTEGFLKQVKGRIQLAE